MEVKAEQFPFNKEKIFSVTEIVILVVAAEYLQVDIEIYSIIENKNVIRILKLLQQSCLIIVHEESDSNCIRFKITKYKDRQKLHDFISLLYDNHLYMIGSMCEIITEFTQSSEVEIYLLYNNKNKLHKIIDNYIQKIKNN